MESHRFSRPFVEYGGRSLGAPDENGLKRLVLLLLVVRPGAPSSVLAP